MDHAKLKHPLGTDFNAISPIPSDPEELPKYSKSKEPVGKTGSYHAVGY